MGAGNLFVTGEFLREADLASVAQGLGSRRQALTSAGGRDAFVMSFTPCGALRWSQSFGGAGSDIGTAIALAAGGRVVLAGDFSGQLVVGGITLTTSGGGAVFVIQLEADAAGGGPDAGVTDGAVGDGAAGADAATCTGPFMMCGGSCIDTRSSSRHCGTCDFTCGGGQICFNSQCAAAFLPEDCNNVQDDDGDLKIVLDTTPFAVMPISTSQQLTPTLASDGTDALVVWTDRRGASLPTLFGARITFAPSPAVSASVLLSAPTAGSWLPDLVFDGTQYAVVWHEAADPALNGIAIARTVSTALVAGAPVTLATTSAPGPVITRTGITYTIARPADPGALGFSQIWARQYDATLTPLAAEFNVPGTGMMALAPAIASSGAAALIAWDDRRNGNQDVYAARTTNAVLDPFPGLALAIGAPNQGPPAVAFDGTGFVVVYIEQGATPVLRAADVSPAGAVSNPRVLLP